MVVDSKYLYSDITDAVLQAHYTVKNALPVGLDIEVYKLALKTEMELLGLTVHADKQTEILYKKSVVGRLKADLVVSDCVVLKLTYSESTDAQAETTLKNFLSFSDFEVGLILNFAPDSQHKRLVFTNDIKNRN